MDRAADGVAGEVGVVQGLGEDALSGECGVAVDEERKIFFAATFAGAILLGAGAADGDGIDGFEMAGVRDQVNVNLAAAAGGVFAGRAHVIFHVAASRERCADRRLQIRQRFPAGGRLRDVSDHVQASAMAHAHDEFDGAALAGGIENFVHQRDQRGDAFERKALAAEIALLHDLLEDVGADEEVEDALLDFFRNFETLRRRFHLLVDPAAALGRVDVVDLDTDGAGVDGAGFAGVLAFVSRVRAFRGDGGSRGDQGRPRGIPIGGRR